MSIDQKISLLVQDQLPDFVQSDYPAFVNFIKAYYEWMEQTSGVTYSTRKLLDYADVDETTDEFLQYFKTKFLPYFPEDILCDKPKLIKTIREFYQKKGSEESLKFLFRVLYNQEISISYPKENILKASDGKWYVPQVFKVTSSNTSPSLDLDTLKKRRGLGTESSASCVIEAAYKTIDSSTNQEIFEIYVSNINRKFLNGENLEISYVAANGSTVYLFSETIIGSLSKIEIDPNNRGLTYKSGDPVVISGGLSAVNPVKAVATVGAVTSGQLQSISVVNGGYGFRVYANGIINVANTGTDTTGSGGAAKISAIGNTTTLNVRTDTINSHALILLSSSNYQFSNFASTNTNTELWRALSIESISVGPIQSVTLSDGGTNYTQTPSLTPASYYNTDESILYYPTIETNSANAALWANTRQNLLDLGRIAYVNVVRGGSGYNSSTDTITPIGLGSDATFTFANNATGEITSVTVTNAGEGYNSIDLLINSSGGTGAELVAYRYGEGAELSTSVDAVGRIQNFTLLNRGSGYISTPNVSLKVMDMLITDWPGDLTPVGTILENDIVYQGTSLAVNQYTYKATVDSYNAATTIVRVFDYSGTIDLNEKLKFQSFNAAVTSTTVYGNGQAKANAVFYDGVVKSNGYFLNTDGFLSADKKLQDSEKYHNFSYVIIAEKALEDYRQALLDILHPSGMKMIGYNQLINKDKTKNIVTSNVFTSNTQNNSGTVSLGSYISANQIITGSGTSFTRAKANDLIVINTGTPSRTQVKKIKKIDSDTSLNVESSLEFIGDGRLILTSGTNVLEVYGNTNPLSIAVSDVIHYFDWDGGQIEVDTAVSSISGNLITVNVTSSSSNTNFPYSVSPVTSGVQYKIISTD